MQRYELNESQVSDDFMHWFKNGEHICGCVLRKNHSKCLSYTGECHIYIYPYHIKVKCELLYEASMMHNASKMRLASKNGRIFKKNFSVSCYLAQSFRYLHLFFNSSKYIIVSNPIQAHPCSSSTAE